jgi:hypothetical protein
MTGPRSEYYEPLPPWFCEAGCGRNCELENVETSLGFLRLTYRCTICQAKVVRHFDLEQGGFVEGPTTNPDHSTNARCYVGSHKFQGRVCEYQSRCARLRRGLDNTKYTGNSVQLSGSKLARIRRSLSEEELKFCFNCFYSSPPEGLGFQQFVAAYSQGEEVDPSENP